MDAQPVVLGEREQHVDDFEPLGAVGIVNPGDLHQLLIMKLVAQDAHRLNHRFALHVEPDFADVLARTRETIAERRLGRVDDAFVGGIFGIGRRHRSIVPARRIFRCSCMMPYSNASAVGGQPGT